MMMREKRCASNDLLLEGKKKKPSNLLQRLGFDHFEEAKLLNNYDNYFCFKTFFFCYNLKKSQRFFGKNENQTMHLLICN
jgi:hypothetical protein